MQEVRTRLLSAGNGDNVLISEDTIESPMDVACEGNKDHEKKDMRNFTDVELPSAMT